jgi:hypothetical protein
MKLLNIEVLANLNWFGMFLFDPGIYNKYFLCYASWRGSGGEGHTKGLFEGYLDWVFFFW